VVAVSLKKKLQRVSGVRLSGAEFWEAAEALLDRQRPGDFNQAMMELGAMVCTPRGPVCLTCPVVQLCATRGEMTSTAKPSPQKKREIHYALARRDDAVFLVQRPRDARLMAGMWELPELDAPARAKEQQAPRSARGGNDKMGELMFTVKHSITVTDYTVWVWRQSASKQIPGEWFALDRLARVALTGLARKILRKAEVIPEKVKTSEPSGTRRALS